MEHSSNGKDDLCLHILKQIQLLSTWGSPRRLFGLVDGKFGKHVESLPEGADVLDYSGTALRLAS